MSRVRMTALVPSAFLLAATLASPLQSGELTEALLRPLTFRTTAGRDLTTLASPHGQQTSSVHETAVSFPGLIAAQVGEEGEVTETAPAEDAVLGSPDRWSFRAGIGFTLDPETFLMTFEGSYEVAKSIKLGPLVQLGVGDKRVILAPSLNAQYVFDLSQHGENVADLKPFLQAGVGFAYFHKDRRFRDDDDVGFLINIGGGLEYYVKENVSIGSNILFNVLPVDALGDHFFFSWQFVTVGFRF